MTLGPSEFLALAPRVLPARFLPYVREVLAAHLVTGVCPLLLLAVMDRETQAGTSSYLTKRGPAGRGDAGHGHGLMQVDDRSHKPFLAATFDGGEPLWTVPAFNVLYGARLLAKNLHAFGGELALAVAAYNCGPGNVRRALAKLPRTATTEARAAAADTFTAKGNYAADVLRRRAALLEAFPLQHPSATSPTE